ncbi:MAG TPA: TRAP transporter small permease [Dehalococcoidia bacterium]|jgi:TRAP-type C4-dicarboxylate transport system permease small subunit|nr:TRAP transporter small permease [Dehalococcoidia bacterium]
MFIRVLKRIGQAANFVEDRLIRYLAAFGMLAVVLVALVEVFRRYIFARSFLWHSDFVIYFMLMSFFLYLGLALKEGAHLRVTVFILLFRRFFGVTAERVLETIVSFVGFVYCLSFTWFGANLSMKTYEIGRVTEGAYYPFWVIFSVLTAGFFLLGIRYAEQFYLHIKGQVSKVSPGGEEPKEC